MEDVYAEKFYENTAKEKTAWTGVHHLFENNDVDVDVDDEPSNSVTL